MSNSPSSNWILAARALSALIITLVMGSLVLIVALDPEQTQPALSVIVAGGSLILALLGIDLGPWLQSVLGRGATGNTRTTDDEPKDK